MKGLRSLLHYCMNLTPYEVRRRQPEKCLPPATFDNVMLALRAYAESQSLPTFVQIGACDGMSGDSVHPFVSSGRLQALVVEPIEQSFRKLKEVYAKVPNVTAIQAAIGASDGTVTLFKVKESGTALDPFWSSQLASFNKTHLLNHGVPETEIEPVEVPCLTLQSLLNKHGLTSVGFLQIDTEGFDAEIVKMALQLGTRPDYINFENVHLKNQALKEVFEELEKHGYVWTHDHWNTLAIHKHVVQNWRITPSG